MTVIDIIGDRILVAYVDVSEFAGNVKQISASMSDVRDMLTKMWGSSIVVVPHVGEVVVNKKFDDNEESSSEVWVNKTHKLPEWFVDRLKSDLGNEVDMFDLGE